MFRRPVIAIIASLSLVAIAACSDDDEEVGSDSTGTSEPGAGTGSCEVADLPLQEAGTLTVATGEPAFEPWVVGDAPESGEGFEAAVVYAVAAQLGFAEDDVTWVRAGFDESIAPGEKDYDFNVQQYSITEERDEVVDFSDGYYAVEQALVGAADGPLADAASLADLQDATLGGALGSTSLQYIEDVIQPSTPPLAFDDNAAAKAAFDAGQVDGLVFDLPTAYFITAVEIEGSSIIGVLPGESETEELGFLFEDGSELVGCINEAIAAIEADGSLAALQEEWLDQGGDIPTLQP